MKNLITLLVFIVFYNGHSFSQALEKDDFVIDVQMGYPNLSFWKSGYSGLSHLSLVSNPSDIHKSIGQFILTSEFFLTDKIGLALGVNYGYYYDYNEYIEESYNNGEYITNTYYREKKTNRLRIYIGPNFHLVRTERLDSYFGIRAGIKKSFFSSNDNFPPNNTSIYSYNDFEFEFPIGLRIAYGLRYFLTESLGFNVEFGLGGPLVSAGLTYKITNNN